MKVTIGGITYEGSEEEIRSIVSNPPSPPPIQVTCSCPSKDYHEGISSDRDLTEEVLNS